MTDNVKQNNLGCKRKNTCNVTDIATLIVKRSAHLQKKKYHYERRMWPACEYDFNHEYVRRISIKSRDNVNATALMSTEAGPVLLLLGIPMVWVKDQMNLLRLSEMYKIGSSSEDMLVNIYNKIKCHFCAKRA